MRTPSLPFGLLRFVLGITFVAIATSSCHAQILTITSPETDERIYLGNSVTVTGTLSWEIKHVKVSWGYQHGVLKNDLSSVETDAPAPPGTIWNVTGLTASQFPTEYGGQYYVKVEGYNSLGALIKTTYVYVDAVGT